MVRAITSPAAKAFEALIIEDIREVFLIYIGNVCYDSRDGNSKVHYLANFDFLFDCDVTWIDSEPRLLRPIVRANICE